MLRSRLTTILIATLVCAQGRLARASGQGQSGSGSSNSSDSSKGSGDSSNSSKSSSDNSAASSKSSNQSTQNSPKDSSQWSTNGTTDWSTHSRGGQVFSIALAVVAVGATVAGVAVSTTASKRGGAPRATTALAAYMRREHAILTHDVSTADGPLLDAWVYDLGLAPSDGRRLKHALEGSFEQGTLLDALDGEIDERHAERFAVAFLRVANRALGKPRMEALIARASRAMAGG